MSKFKNFREAYDTIKREFLKNSQIVEPATWQSLDVSSKPEMGTHELEEYFFQFPIGSEELQYHRFQVGPNLPWADDHFDRDRISGEPLNPGYTWQAWPWGNKADSFRDEQGQFNHTYAERYWPKLAGLTPLGKLQELKDKPPFIRAAFLTPDPATSENIQRALSRRGIRYPYGDLNDVVNLLVKTPLTRNAYLPIFFPEDTGVVHGGRTPCTLGYLFRMRNNRLSVSYYIRSCDFVRHFQDDVYLTIRLLLWVLDECREKDPSWSQVIPGMFSMNIGSFHIFRNDWQKVMGI